MSIWAFDPPCSMEAVSAIPEDDWFSDTSIPEPLEEIRVCDYGTPLLPLEEPPSCPSIARSVQAKTRLVAPGDQYFTISVSETPGCAFQFLPDVGFPLNCPELPVGPVDAEIERVPFGQEYMRLHLFRDLIRASEGSWSSSVAGGIESCAIAVRLQAGFADALPSTACKPVYKSVITSRMVPPGQKGADLEINSFSDCSWVPELDVRFPCVPPAPLRHVTGSYVRPGYERVDLDYFSVSGDTCSHSGDMTIALPRPGGLLGKVLSGTGTAWSVRLYPNGPSDEGTAYDHTITVPDAPSTYTAPTGAWIAPVQPFADWGQIPNAAQLVYALPSFLGLEIVISPSGGIPANSSASCALQRFSAGTVTSAGSNVTVYNIFSSTVGLGSKRVIVGRIDGYRVAIAEDCADSE